VVKLANILTGHIDLVYQGYHYHAFPATAFSNDSKEVAFEGSDGRIHIWEIAARKIILTTDSIGGFIGGGLGEMMSWSPDGTRIIVETLLSTAGNPRALQVWNSLTRHRLYNIVETPSMSLTTWIVISEPGFNQVDG
jgi:WD40 repeat protein